MLSLGMKLFVWCLGGLMLTSNNLAAQNDFKLYLVGDAGDHKEAGETLKSVRDELKNNDHSAIIFLGDNSYKDILWGIIPFGYKGFDSTRNTIDKINSQLAILDDYKGYVYFVPGNHDWWNRPTYSSGIGKLKMEINFIKQNLKNNKSIANPDEVFLPDHGDYGPSSVVLNNGLLRLVFIDTYRIILSGMRKNKISAEENAFYGKLDSVINLGYRQHQKVVVLAHHPVYSVGPNNNSISNPALFRRIKSSMTDFPSYKAMSEKIVPILKKYPGIYYVSGHLHALQYFFTSDSVHYIISGAGSKEKMLNAAQVNKFDHGQAVSEYILWNTGGFFEIDFHNTSASTLLYYKDGKYKCVIQ